REKPVLARDQREPGGRQDAEHRRPQPPQPAGQYGRRIQAEVRRLQQEVRRRARQDRQRCQQERERRGIVVIRRVAALHRLAQQVRLERVQRRIVVQTGERVRQDEAAERRQASQVERHQQQDDHANQRQRQRPLLADRERKDGRLHLPSFVANKRRTCRAAVKASLPPSRYTAVSPERRSTNIEATITRISPPSTPSSIIE